MIAHTKAKLLDTRKTTPNFRLMEKWAVAIGGGVNHRFGLFDMIILKDNHVDYAGSITQAVRSTRDYLRQTGKDLKIVIETRSLDEVDGAGRWRHLPDHAGQYVAGYHAEAVARIHGKYMTESPAASPNLRLWR